MVLDKSRCENPVLSDLFEIGKLEAIIKLRAQRRPRLLQSS